MYNICQDEETGSQTLSGDCCTIRSPGVAVMKVSPTARTHYTMNSVDSLNTVDMRRKRGGGNLKHIFFILPALGVMGGSRHLAGRGQGPVL